MTSKGLNRFGVSPMKCQPPGLACLPEKRDRGHLYARYTEPAVAIKLWRLVERRTRDLEGASEEGQHPSLFSVLKSD